MSLEQRIARLEAPWGDPTRTAAHTYAMLRACYMVLSRLDDDPMLTYTDLRAMAQAEARSGCPPDYPAALQAVWEEHHDLERRMPRLEAQPLGPERPQTPPVIVYEMDEKIPALMTEATVCTCGTVHVVLPIKGSQ
jgi:hypothetical protein